MIKRGRTLLIALLIAGATTVGLAGSASAAPVTTGSTACSAVLTVVPSEIFYSPGHLGTWQEFGTVTEVGSCAPGATSPVLATGHWERDGDARDTTTGECPRARFSLQSTFNGDWTDYFEMTPESAVTSTQLIGIRPFYTPPIPVGTDSFSVPLPSGGVVVAKTDPVACTPWPTTDDPPPPPSYSLPAPPTFHIEFDNPSVTSLLQACLTVQGVVPRTCLKV